MCCGKEETRHATHRGCHGRAYLGLVLAISISGSAQAAKAPTGQEIFRYDTFGDEQLWTDVWACTKPCSLSRPSRLLSVGLKVDADALLPPIVRALESGQLNVNDPAVTRRLLN